MCLFPLKHKDKPITTKLPANLNPVMFILMAITHNDMQLVYNPKHSKMAAHFSMLIFEFINCLFSQFNLIGKSLKTLFLLAHFDNSTSGNGNTNGNKRMHVAMMFAIFRFFAVYIYTWMCAKVYTLNACFTYY